MDGWIDSQTLYILVHYPTRSESVAILKCNSGPQGPCINKVIRECEKPGPGALERFFDQPGASRTVASERQYHSPSPCMLNYTLTVNSHTFINSYSLHCIYFYNYIPRGNLHGMSNLATCGIYVKLFVYMSVHC